MSYFPTYSYSKNKIEVELDLSKYETNSDSKNATGVDSSQFIKKDDLANLKSEVNKIAEIDADKLKPVFVDLKK